MRNRHHDLAMEPEAGNGRAGTPAPLERRNQVRHLPPDMVTLLTCTDASGSKSRMVRLQSVSADGVAILIDFALPPGCAYTVSFANSDSDITPVPVTLVRTRTIEDGVQLAYFLFEASPPPREVPPARTERRVWQREIPSEPAAVLSRGTNSSTVRWPVQLLNPSGGGAAIAAPEGVSAGEVVILSLGSLGCEIWPLECVVRYCEPNVENGFTVRLEFSEPCPLHFYEAAMGRLASE